MHIHLVLYLHTMGILGGIQDGASPSQSSARALLRDNSSTDDAAMSYMQRPFNAYVSHRNFDKARQQAAGYQNKGIGLVYARLIHRYVCFSRN